MAEVLGVVSSLIAVAQISGSIVSLCYEYRSGLKNADANVMQLATEVKSFRDILEESIRALDELGSNGVRLEAINVLATSDGPLTQAQKELAVLEKRLGPRDGHGIKSLGRILTWPLKEAEVLKTLNRINWFKSSLVASAAIDHL
jgi:ankyrin repeat domain-containing protein 50